MRIIIKRKKYRIGHVLCGDGQLKEAIEGRLMGERSRERRRIGMLDSLQEDGTYVTMKRKQMIEQYGGAGLFNLP